MQISFLIELLFQTPIMNLGLLDLFAGINLVSLIGVVAVVSRWRGKVDAEIKHLQEVPPKLEELARQISYLCGQFNRRRKEE